MAADTINLRPAAGAVRVGWAIPYVGLPFHITGFDFRGVHCWGLICLIYERELGIVLPRYGETTSKDLLATARHVGDGIKTGPWLPVVGHRVDFDVILMSATTLDAGRLVRVPSHIGIAVGCGAVLHVEAGIDSVCVSDNHPSIRHRILGAYRHDRACHTEPQPVLKA